MTEAGPAEVRLDLDLLSRVMPGLSFDDPEQRAFLTCSENAELQAAPGSGKTTLLVAKLCLMAECWREPRRGICVLSHTNVARAEVQSRLARQPRGQALLGYPHFIGTSTAFIHQFLALPFLRGQGISVKTVDDDTFEAAALRQMKRNFGINAWLKHQHDQPGIARKLLIDPDTLRLANVEGIPKPGGRVRSGLEKVRKRMTSRGIFLYDDLVAFAELALVRRPSLAEALSRRFPIVFVDEAQDTPANHLALLRAALPASTIQWIGDCNQNLYNRGDACWKPADGTLDLGASRRFGPRTAAFASKITVTKPQVIVGNGEPDRLHAVVLFDRSTIGEVLPAFGRLVSEVAGLPPSPNVWAIAARHKVPEKRPTAWPNCISDYWERYTHPKPAGDQAGTLLGVLREARRQAHTLNSVRTAFSGYSTAIFRYLARTGWEPPEDARSPGRRWSALDEACPGARLDLRRLLRDALVSPLPNGEADWRPIAQRVSAVVEGLLGTAPGSDDPFLAFTVTLPSTAKPKEANVFTWSDGHREVQIRTGTIHSVKGRTHDITMVLETNEHQKMDVEEALKRVFGGAPPPKGVHVPNALTNVFVGATRPRFGLCLAVRREAVSVAMETALSKAGWSMIDLTQLERG